MRKRMICWAMMLVLALSLVPWNTKQVKAASNEDYVTDKLDLMIKAHDGTTWMNNAFFTKGQQCYEFAHYVFNSIYNRGWSVVGSNDYYRLSNLASDVTTVGSRKKGCGEASLKKLISEAQPGDWIQVWWYWDEKNQKGIPHSMIVYSVESDGVYVFDANGNSKNDNRIAYRKIKYSELYQAICIPSNGGLSLYRYCGSKAKLETDTRYPLPFKAYIKAGQNIACYNCNKKESGEIYTTDECTVLDIYTNGWCRVQVPWDDFDGNYKIKMVHTSEFLDSDYVPVQTKVEKKITTYIRKGASEKMGSIAAGKKVTVVGTSGDYAQVIYSVGSGKYACGWAKLTYSVKYNANGGSGAPSSQTKTYGKNLTLSSTKPTRSGYTFMGWATDKSATSSTYKAGGTYKENEGATLYAVWEENCSKGHSYSYVVSKSPTISVSGSLKGTCSKCSGTTIVTLPKLNTTDYSYRVTKTATCTMAGTGKYIWKTTTYGSIFFEVTIPAPGHSYTSKVTDPTCTEQGYTTHSCSTCGSSYVDSIIEACGHSLSAWNEIQASSCEDEGIWERSCINCVYVETCVTDALGHSYDSETTPPTCTNRGYTVHACYCGDRYVDMYTDAIGHSMEQWHVTVTPGCTSKGEESRMCMNCTFCEIREVDALGHTYSEEVIAPSCTGQGYTIRRCHCGDSYTDDYVDVLDHTMGDWCVIVEPNCTESGTEQRKCTNCDYSEMRNIDAAGHNYMVTIKPASCIEQGYWIYSCNCGYYYIDYCSQPLGHSFVIYVSNDNATCVEDGTMTAKCWRCDATDTITDVGSATGHAMGQWQETKPSTCTEKGIEQSDCVDCDHYEIREIEAKGHSYTEKVTSPTCTEKGYTTHTCACGASYVDTYTPVLGHDYSEWYQTKAPTLEAEGEERRDCSRCDDYQTRKLPMLVHDYTSVVTPPSCTEQGYTTHTCSNCGDAYVDSYVNALGHSFTKYASNSDATCIADGTKTAKCDRCDAIDTVTDVGSKTGHDMGEWYVTKDPTCTEKGTEQSDCAKCDHYETREIAANGHTIVIDKEVEATCTASGLTEGKHCSMCGEVLISQKEAPAKGHSYSEKVTSPTCTDKGYTTHTCACGDSYVDAYTAALGHAWDEGVVTEATCFQDGYTTYTCYCGASYVDDRIPSHVINPFDDNFGDRFYEKLIKATCTEAGGIFYICKECGESTLYLYMEAKGHDLGEWETVKEPNYLEKGLKERHCSRCDVFESEEINNNPFVDVKADRFETAILWAYYNGITTGTGDGTTFSPENACTRKQIVTFLWRAAGEPEPKSMVNPFVDVKSDRFEKAILWAYYEGITTGTGDGTTFSPEATCTRKQIVTFLWRYHGKPAPESSEITFTDVKNDRFAAAILWAAEQGITTGTGNGSTFSPENPCTRKQIVTFLYRNLVK